MISKKDFKKQWMEWSGDNDLPEIDEKIPAHYDRVDTIVSFLQYLYNEGLISVYYDRILEDFDSYTKASTGVTLMDIGYCDITFEYQIGFLYKYDVADLDELYDEMIKKEKIAEKINDLLKDKAPVKK